jgi:transposase
LTILGIDVSGEWRDGFFLPGQERFRYPNTAEGHIALISKLQHLSGQVKVGFEATGGREWGLWRELVAAGIAAVQLKDMMQMPRYWTAVYGRKTSCDTA